LSVRFRASMQLLRQRGGAAAGVTCGPGWRAGSEPLTRAVSAPVAARRQRCRHPPFRAGRGCRGLTWLAELLRIHPGRMIHMAYCLSRLRRSAWMHMGVAVKSGTFEHHAPTTVEQALALLGEYGDEA